MVDENPYSLLSHVQGFDSFSLGPSSTDEAIARAFQTQSLMWHPEKNPGDPHAREVYRRMEKAYSTLMDPDARALIDAKCTSELRYRLEAAVGTAGMQCDTGDGVTRGCRCPEA